MKRVIAYIDGYNLYYGLREKKWKQFYWLNLQEMMRRLLRADQELVKTKYFTTRVKAPRARHERQAVFLDALRTLSDFEIFFGHFLRGQHKCRHCGCVSETHHEKMTDVNIATELLVDAFQGHFDVALLVSADSDLVGPVKAVRRLFSDKRVVVFFPPARHSNALAAVTTALTIHRRVLARSVFPDQVVTSSGYVLERPVEWQ